MASRGKKRGKVVEESFIEKKENISSRRTGRAKKVVNYVEDSPVVKKKAKDDAKLEKEIIKIAKKKETQKRKLNTKETEKYMEPEKEKPKSTKSKLPTKARGKTKEIKDTVDVLELDIDEDKNEASAPEVKNISHRPDNKSTSKRNKKGKKDTPDEKVTITEKETELLEQTEIPDECELGTSAVTEIVNNSRIRGHSNKKQTKANPRKPLSNRNEKIQNVQDQNVTTDIEIGTKSKYQHSTKQNKQKETQEQDKITKESNTNKNDTDAIDAEEFPDVSDGEHELKNDKGNNANSTFTLGDIVETPRTTNVRNTPNSDRNTKHNTSSVAKRMSEVLGSIRKESVGGNTPKSGHCACGNMMTEINEILELVTEQLTDLKSEMENVKTTNESLQTDLDTNRNETRQLKEEMNNLKNVNLQQIQTNTTQTSSRTPRKSTSNQNEIDLLWTQCEVQKKTIRSLHNEVDNTKTEFNQRFEKYKRAMIFVLSKTRPDITHADVSKLRNLLNKTEKCLDSTLDEICSSMETEMPRSTPNKATNNGPVISISCPSSPPKENSRNEKVLVPRKNVQNIIKTANHLSTPKRNPQESNPFQTRPKIRRTPVCESKK
ncbi:Hypothetical predicted protein [Mytilus galloprovincialis]|uniref:Uncharacterized protein n=1 Tax=Mytilus galloprovincialis TaxID=29158 RepID=A0A8B6E8Q2_MYTGA|nr:Hypothetical predicted protein [Mytilus galloprovincialis]